MKVGWGSVKYIEMEYWKVAMFIHAFAIFRYLMCITNNNTFGNALVRINSLLRAILLTSSEANREERPSMPIHPSAY
jgi:hypothetical protein